MTSPLKPGAVAMIDALGFRGIWRRAAPENVVEALESLRASAITAAKDADLHVHMFSDTIALGATTDSEDLSEVLNALVNATAEIISRAVFGNPPLLFRGCVAVGRLIASPTVLLGEAVDRAASGHEQAEGAMVWFTEESSDEWLDVGLSGKSFNIVHCDLPLKKSVVGTRAVNPLAVFVHENPGGHPGAAAHYDKFVEATRSAFEYHSDGPLSPEVMVKQANTVAFLDDCRQYIDRIHQIELQKLSGTYFPDQ